MAIKSDLESGELLPDGLSLTYLGFDLTFYGDGLLTEPPGVALRDTLGAALHRLSVSHDSTDPLCKCNYCRLFRPRFTNPDGSLRAIDVPPAFFVEIQCFPDREIRRGDAACVGIIMARDGEGELNAVISAMSVAGMIGIGEPKVRFEARESRESKENPPHPNPLPPEGERGLRGSQPEGEGVGGCESVEEAEMAGPLAPAPAAGYRSNERIGDAPHRQRVGKADLVRIAGGFAGQRRVRIVFETPAFIRLQNERKFGLTFGEFIGSILNRLHHGIAHHWEDHDIADRTRDLRNALVAKAANEVTIREVDLRWISEERRRYYKARQTLSGFTGSITYEGNLEPFWPLIVAGSFSHIGYGAAFDLGRYSFEACELCDCG